MIDRPAEVGIENDMGLGPTDIRGKTRPLGADAGQMQAGGVDQPHDLAHLPAHLATNEVQHARVEACEHLRRPVAIGVGEGGALRDPAAEVIQARFVAGHRRFDVPQRLRPGKLAEKQGDELMLALEFAHQIVAAKLRHEPPEDGPRNEIEHVAKNGSLMAHDIAPFWRPDDS